MLAGLTTSNGIGWSPGDDVMYLVDSSTQSVDGFDFDAAAGTMANRRRLIDVPADAGLPDGLAVDEDGRLWIALWDGWGMRCYRPDGVLDGSSRFPPSVSRAVHAGGVFRIRPGCRGRPSPDLAADLKNRILFWRCR